MTLGQENGKFTIGNVQSPLSGSIANLPFKDLDPVAAAALDFFTHCIQVHCGPRWDAECVRAERLDLIGKVVAEAIPYDIAGTREENNFQFPLLVITAVSEDVNAQLSVNRLQITSTYSVQYVIDPQGAAQKEFLQPFLKHVSRTLISRTSQGKDDSYQGGRGVWNDAGAWRARITGARYGRISSFSSAIDFPAVDLTFVVQELDNGDERNFVSFQGISVGSVDLVTDGNPNIADFVVVSNVTSP